MINGDLYPNDRVVLSYPGTRIPGMGWVLEDSIWYGMYFDTLNWIDTIEDEELRDVYLDIAYDELMEEYLL